MRGHIVQHSLGVPEMWICGVLGLLQGEGEEELQRSVFVLIFRRAWWGSHTQSHYRLQITPAVNGPGQMVHFPAVSEQFIFLPIV